MAETPQSGEQQQQDTIEVLRPDEPQTIHTTTGDTLRLLLREELRGAQIASGRPWYLGLLRDYGTLVAIILAIVAGLLSLGALRNSVDVLKTEVARIRTAQDAQVQKLADLDASAKQLNDTSAKHTDALNQLQLNTANLNAGMKQLNDTDAKQTTILDQLQSNLADNTAAIQQLTQAIDRLTIKLSDIERIVNDNRNILSRLDERTKKMN